MRWTQKAALNKVFDVLPGGSALRQASQRRWGGRVRLSSRLPSYRWYRAAAVRYGAKPLCEITAYEFGAGRELGSAIMLWCYGIPRQIVIDRERLVDDQLVAKAMAEIAELDEPEMVRRPAKGMFYLDMCIEYHAPVAAHAVPRHDGSMDLIVSSNVLEHIPSGELLPIMKECRRLCSPGGVVSMAIDYSDHYAQADPGIGRTHFLRYADEEFRRFQSSFLYQNRLRHSDYRRVFQEVGFTVREEAVIVEPEDLEAVRRDALAKRFDGYDAEDLAARHGMFALTPAG